MLRNVEKDPAGGPDTIRQSVLKVEADRLPSYAQAMADGRSFLYHLSEGTSAALRTEFSDLDAAACAGEHLVGIHSTALTAADFAAWSPPGAVVWSPFSNLWLYGATTDVLAARTHGHLVCLGSDWSPSGTRNILGELKVADLWNREAWQGALTPLELCELVTRNPGLALERAWQVPVGRLVPGALADLTVTARTDPDEYRSLIAATEREVRLVVVGGRAVYGTASLLARCGTPPADIEPVTVAGVDRALVMTLPEELLPEDLDLRTQATMSWADGLAVLADVWADPAAAVRRSLANRPKGEPPLRFVPDMPRPHRPDGTVPRELTDLELDALVMPAREGLAHDRAWFDRVDRLAPAHARILAGLADYYPRSSQ